MTANDIFKLGTALIQEKVGEDPDTSFFTPMFLTIALEECLGAENAYRLTKGEEELEEAPVIKSLTDEVPFMNGKLTKIALPYALASHYYRDNNDMTHEQMFRAEFVSAVMDATPFVTESVTDYYGG